MSFPRHTGDPQWGPCRTQATSAPVSGWPAPGQEWPAGPGPSSISGLSPRASGFTKQTPLYAWSCLPSTKSSSGLQQSLDSSRLKANATCSSACRLQTWREILALLQTTPSGSSPQKVSRRLGDHQAHGSSQPSEDRRHLDALWFAPKRSVFLLYRGSRILLVPRAGGPVPGSQETDRRESLQGPGLGPTLRPFEFQFRLFHFLTAQPLGTHPPAPWL